MVRKNEQVSNTVEVGYCSCGDTLQCWISGIRELFDILQIPVSSYLDDLFTPFENGHMLSHIHADIHLILASLNSIKQ